MDPASRILIGLGCILTLLAKGGSSAEEAGPYYPPSKAPIATSGGEAPITALNKAETGEIIGEFKGLLYYGQSKYSYDKWPGKSLSDCSPASSEPWTFRCEMITGHADASYYFYAEPGRRQPTLQRLDVRFNVADAALLRSLKRPLRTLFGEEVYQTSVDSEEAAWGVSTPFWRWRSVQDLAFLYMGAGQNGEDGQLLARFQWRRTPLLQDLSLNSQSLSKALR